MVQMEGIKEKYFTTYGRLNRWPYFVRGSILAIIVFLIDLVIDPPAVFNGGWVAVPSVSWILNCLKVLFIIPSFTLIIRRLHDLNYSGWWALLVFVPCVNFILGIYLTFFSGTVGENRFGADPLEAEEQAQL